MEIVPMTADQIPQIAALEAACFSAPWSERSLTGELTNPLSLWLTAVEGDTIAGYIGSQAVLGEADMMNLAVHPRFRRQGIGQKLVCALVGQLKERQIHSLTLEVRASNAPALALYAGLGFAAVGRRPHYYEKPREDAVILRKEWQV